jgi:hypothetical protein
MGSEADGAVEPEGRKPIVTPQADGSVHIDSIGPGESVEVEVPWRIRPEGAPKFVEVVTDVDDDEEEDDIPDGAGSWHYGWHYADRRMPFPWGLAVFFLVLLVLAGLGIVWTAQALGLF